MGTDASPPSLVPLGAPSTSGVHTKLTIDISSDVNNMEIANPPDSSVPPAVVVHTPKLQTPSLQPDVATLTEAKSTKRMWEHANTKVSVLTDFGD